MRCSRRTPPQRTVTSSGGGPSLSILASNASASSHRPARSHAVSAALQACALGATRAAGIAARSRSAASGCLAAAHAAMPLANDTALGDATPPAGPPAALAAAAAHISSRSADASCHCPALSSTPSTALWVTTSAFPSRRAADSSAAASRHRAAASAPQRQIGGTAGDGVWRYAVGAHVFQDLQRHAHLARLPREQQRGGVADGGGAHAAGGAGSDDAAHLLQ
jgi:hypothetical protein